MPRLRRKRSRVLDKASARLHGLSALDPNFHAGSLKIQDLREAIHEAQEAQEAYNKLLSAADNAQRTFQECENRANELATRLFAWVAARYGRRSNEYVVAGGKPPPARRKRRKPKQV